MYKHYPITGRPDIHIIKFHFLVFSLLAETLNGETHRRKKNCTFSLFWLCCCLCRGFAVLFFSFFHPSHHSHSGSIFSHFSRLSLCRIEECSVSQQWREAIRASTVTWPKKKRKKTRASLATLKIFQFLSVVPTFRSEPSRSSSLIEPERERNCHLFLFHIFMLILPSAVYFQLLCHFTVNNDP